MRINMDETALCLHQGGKAGYIFLDKGHDVMQNVSKSIRRTYVTHVAFVCDCPEIQKRLPQMLICSERTLPKKKLAALQARLGGVFIVVRGKSAWVNTDICVGLVKVLADALRPFRNEVQPIFLLDACKVHIGPRMWNAAARHGIWQLIVPAGMTWLLQVLDTHGFKSYKDSVYTFHQIHCFVHGSSGGDLDALCDAVKDATRDVLENKSWASAFDSNGFGNFQWRLRPAVLETLGWEALPDTSCCHRPTPEQIRLCLPRKTKLYYGTIWRHVESTLSTSLTAVVASASAGVPAMSIGVPAMLTGEIVGSSSISSSSSKAIPMEPPATIAPGIFMRTRRATTAKAAMTPK